MKGGVVLLLLLLLLLLRRSTQMQRIEVFCAFQQQSSVLGIGKILTNFVASEFFESAVATLEGLLRPPTQTLLCVLAVLWDMLQ